MGTELGQWSSESSSVTYESAGGSVMLSRFVSNELRLWCLCLFLLENKHWKILIFNVLWFLVVKCLCFECEEVVGNSQNYGFHC